MNIGNIVKNDMEAAETTSILLLTGPNNGGKSVYLKSIGIAAVMAQLGMPICANRAELPLFTRILCHFPAADSAEYQDGRRTSRSVEQPDSGFSRAYEIAAQFGLQFKENREA